MGPVIRRGLTTRRVATSEITPQQRPVASASLLRRDRALSRSTDMVTAVLRLDTATDPHLRRELSEWLEGLFVAADVAVPVGFFARCYLGGNYVDHRLLLTGAIAEHYTRDDAPPPPWAAARPLVRAQAYAYVEVYDDGNLVPVRADGTSVS